MEKLEVYCDQTFLENFYLLTNKKLSELEENEYWIHEMDKFIHGNCTLITDISEKEVLRRSLDNRSYDYNPNFRKLWKNGRITFVSYAETFDQMKVDNEYFNGKISELFFLTINKTFCTNIENRFGLICVSNEEMKEKLPDLFVFASIPINRIDRAVEDWNFLSEFRYPSNAAVIADNHILKYNALKEANIISILKNILPLQLDNTFDLTIFTREVKDINIEYRYLKEKILDKLPYPVNLSIGVVAMGTLGLHDRDILTNYCWYHSGAGLNLFNTQGPQVRLLNDTTVIIFPAPFVGLSKKPLDNTVERSTPAQETYFSARKVFRKVWRELPDKIGIHRTFIGERKNRLLD